MSKEYLIKDDVYLVLLKYFQGDIIYLTADILKGLKKGDYKGEPVKELNKSILKVFVTILKLKKQKPEIYADMKWVYPEWDKEEKEKKLRNYFPEDYEEELEVEKDKFLLRQEDGTEVYVESLSPESPRTFLIEPENGKHFTFEEQVDILIKFYGVYEPTKTAEAIKGIVNRRRPRGTPNGTRIPSEPWIELCAKLQEKYEGNPLWRGDEKKIEEVDDEIFNGVIPQRKAFIEWVNDVFYKNQIKDYKEYLKNLPEPENEGEKLRALKIYQFFIKEYLSIETPFRGLLIYHGLGTGKTATSVVTAEGLSKTMPIFTFLPASLETEFIKEVRGWGDILFNVDKNNWIFYPFQEIKGDLKLRKMLNDEYGINEKTINGIVNATKKKLKKMIEEDENKSSNMQNIMRKINEIKGIYLQSPSLKDENRTIYTSSGKPILKDGETFTGECIELKEEQKMFIDQQINFLIQLKYNFIHYNGFPEVDKVNFKEKILDELEGEDEGGTSNQRKVQYFVKQYQDNVDAHGVLSPFRENVIIVDEVHNFVNEIMNGSAPANVFYDWIINSEDVKIVFLSGTPIINKPAEIAVLYNMLRGIIHIFDFSVLSDRDDYEVQQELRQQFYQTNSSIEQLHVSRKKGKLVISFMKNKTNYESVLENDVIKTVKFNNHSYEDFFKEIMDGLTKAFDEKDIKPNQEQLKGLSVNKLKRGIPEVFDEDLQLIFNRKQRLFDIYENNTILDLSNNENFMEYFLDDNYNIPEKKQVLLRRMLLGLTSYYPIDRSSIVNMPEIIEPKILPQYKDYNIVNNINIVPCFMTSIQWVNYEEEYSKEKLKKLQQLRRKHLYSDSTSTFNIRTRQNCNVVYEDDSFRVEKDEIKKEDTYQMMARNGHFSYEGTLHLFSPKFHQILGNMQRYLNKGVPTGKILYYSDFRHESGSEAFEKILIQNGYEKYDSEKEEIEDLIQKKSIKKRYTFITGKESQEQRRINKEAFNHKGNLRGEYIHIILISSSGAEGISLKAVRQVHVMEPFWNYIRVDQVLGRAARMESHTDLPDDERNVEQYLYLTMLPEGNTVEEVFDSLQELEWSEVDKISLSGDVKKELVEKHKSVYKTITKILSMKKETKGRTVDQELFDIMERKYNISSKISEIIKEASVDCIQNTRDDIQLNEKCLRFSKKLEQEEAHFPGITSSQLNEIDQKQFKSHFTFHIKPDTYVVLAKKNEQDIFIYYRVQDEWGNIDIRYIRENGIRLADYDPFQKYLSYYEKNDHPLNELLGKKFSVFQSIYDVPEYLIESKIEKNIFPGLDEIINDENKKGVIIKYNISEKLFYSPVKQSRIIKLYDYQNYIDNPETIESSEALILRNGKLFKTNK
jgi:hypothetical protein